MTDSHETGLGCRAGGWTAQNIIQMGQSYWRCFALHAAVTLDIFTAAGQEPVTVAYLARESGCQERSLDMLLSALCSMGFMYRKDDTVQAVPSAHALLSKSSPEYIGFILLHMHSLVPYWSQLAESVREGEPARPHSVAETKSAAEREAFIMGMFNIAKQQAGQIAKLLPLGRVRRLLDLGGGPGTYAVFFCLEHPELEATIFDLPSSRPFAESVIKRYGLQNRVNFVEGNFFESPLPHGYDAVWISQILHGENPDDAELLIHKAARLLQPGGTIYIQDFLLNDDRMGPEHPALFGLNMLVGTDGGQAYTQGEILAYMRAAGLEDCRRLEASLPQGCGILAGQAPQ